MNFLEYTAPENWAGGFYELSIEYHPVGNNNKINDVLIALQNCPFFDGLWEKRDNFKKDILTLPLEIENDSVTSIYGTVLVSDEITLPCVVTIIRINEESDWLDIAIPQAILEKIYPYKYPLTSELNPWLKQVDEVLIKLAEFIYKHSPFNLAIIGEEVSGYTNHQDITIEHIKNITCLGTVSLQERLEVQGKELSNQLILF
ncbi:MAG: hypothetical protein ABS942_18875 [Solibacillus sp.]|uniref:hypothetical protein n=1 Tax=Solibacillus sp. TaxID=1909654 RepID=UPI0033151BBD